MKFETNDGRVYLHQTLGDLNKINPFDLLLQISILSYFTNHA